MTATSRTPRIPIVEGQPSYVIKTSRPRHLLVIEDSLDSVHTLVVLLRDMGHVVDYAINGYAGLEIARRMRPEFVLLDIGLPGLDGYDVCRQIKADPSLRDTKVVMITAYAGEDYRQKSELAGSHLHLVKPVPIPVLEAVLA